MAAKNKNLDKKTSSRVGILDSENLTVSDIDGESGEFTYDLKEMLNQFDGRKVSITVSYEDDAPVIEEV